MFGRRRPLRWARLLLIWTRKIVNLPTESRKRDEVFGTALRGTVPLERYMTSPQHTALPGSLVAGTAHPLRVLLLGCGGIGSIVAASLLRQQVDLDVVTGSAQVRDAIRQHGLRVRELNGQTWGIAATGQVVARVDELPTGHAPYDVALVTTKATTLLAAVQELLPHLASTASVVLMQNGLPEPAVAALLGPARVIGCVVGWGATHIEPGYSARTSKGGMQLGRLHSRTPDADLLHIAEVLGRAFAVRVVADLAGVRWSKLAINCATSTLGAAGGDTLGRLLRHRFVRRLALEVWGELSAVAAAEGVKLAKVAGTLDIAKLAISSDDRRRRIGSPALFLKHSVLLALGLKFRRMRSSMAIAIARGRKPEIDFLNGEIIRRGQQHQIPTPVNAALVALIHDITAQRIQPSLAALHAVYRQHCTDAAIRAIPGF